MNMKPFTLATTLLISMGVNAMDNQKLAPVQTIKKASRQQVIEGPDKIFTGTVAIKPLTDVTESMNASSAYVSFNASARSFWHTHPKGQYLIVTEGEGLVQEWGKPAEKIAVGDVIYCPPGVKHWHGASSHSAMTHISIAGSDENGKNVDWLEPVSEEQYKEASN